MNNNFNLTKPEGYKDAIAFLQKHGWLLTPNGWAVHFADKLINKIISPEKSTKKQLEAVNDIIKCGKDNNVSSMKIKVSHNTGIRLKGKSDIHGVPIDINFDIGNEGDAYIEVKYK